MSEALTPALRFLIELRQRLMICLLIVAILFSGLAYFSNSLFTYLALPLLKSLPVGQGLIATDLVAPFFVPIEFAFMLALLIAAPIFLYQLWRFIAPALYQHEKKLVWLLLIASVVLFYLGVVFAYFVIFPIVFQFMTQTAPKGVNLSPDISAYLDFTMKLFFIFGGMFEVPIVVVLLIWSGVVTRAQLISYRSYVIVGAFIAAMLIGPPDVLSQCLLALPLWLLFEVGVFCSRWIKRFSRNEEII